MADHLPLIVGLSGYAGVGKTEVARYLSAAHNYTPIKFAGPLKSMLRAIGLTEDEIEGNRKDRPCVTLGMRTPREAMQLLGTEWGRDNFGPNFWVNIAMDRTFDVIDQGGAVVIDDVRFESEVSAIKTNGGVVLNVTRPGVGPVNGHSSDNQEIDFDAKIVNGGSRVDLCEAVDFTLEMLMAKRKARSTVPPFATSAFVL